MTRGSWIRSPYSTTHGLKLGCFLASKHSFSSCSHGTVAEVAFYSRSVQEAFSFLKRSAFQTHLGVKLILSCCVYVGSPPSASLIFSWLSKQSGFSSHYASTLTHRSEITPPRGPVWESGQKTLKFTQCCGRLFFFFFLFSNGLSFIKLRIAVSILDTICRVRSVGTVWRPRNMSVQVRSSGPFFSGKEMTASHFGQLHR